MSRDENALLIVVITAVVAYFLLYHPATGDLLWVDNLNTVEGYTFTNPHPFWLRHNGALLQTYGAPPYCARYVSTGYGVTATKTINPPISNDPSMGEYGFLTGARIKIKEISNAPNWQTSGGVIITLNDADNNKLAGFRVGKGWNNNYFYIWAGYPSEAEGFPRDQWVDVEVYFNPQKTGLYLNGNLVNEDTLTHLNSPPYSIKIDCEGATGLTEVLIDQLYVKKATEAYLG